MLKKIIMYIIVTIFLTWIMIVAYAEFAEDQTGMKSEDDVNAETQSPSGEPANEKIKLLMSDTEITIETGSLPVNIESGGIVTLYGGERILKIPRNDLNYFKDEAQSRLGEPGEFGKYLFQSNGNGAVAVYLDTNEKISIIDQNNEAVLSLIISNPDEMKKGAGEYPQNKLLTSNDRMFFDNVVDELFDTEESIVYIPRDTNTYDNEPVPKIIVRKGAGIAVQHIRAGELDYFAIGFGSFPEDKIKEIMNRNGVFESSGGSGGSQVRTNNMADDPIAPIPEMNTFALMIVGLIGLFGIIGLRERR